jgi:hypothetical protein
MDPVSTSQAVAKAADYAAIQSDRWMFVATLIVFLLAIGFVAKWLMARNDALQARVDGLQKEFNEFLQNRHANMATVVEANTLMLGKSMTALESATTLLKQVADSVERRKESER